jgi:hypothetical protein
MGYIDRGLYQCVSGVSVLRVGAFVFVLLEEAEGRGFRP